MKYASVLAGLLLSILLAMPALASDVRLISDPSVPGAVGKAHLDKDKNGNLILKLEVYHLAQPTALTPAKQTYVVWTQGRGKAPQNQGQLKVNNNLEGKFEATVPRETFDLFVTAEDISGAENPSDPKVLSGTLQP